MDYRTVLVHLDDSRHSDARLSFALDFALKHNAHLVGMYVVCQDLLRPLFKRDDSLNLARYEAQCEARRTRAHEHFLAEAQRSGCLYEWQAPAGFALQTATLHARHADIVIVGQDDPDDQASYIARDFIADLVMTAGRPVIVLPRAGRVASFGSNVVVAWDGSREAARALADALPILRHARFVTVTTVERHPDRDEPAGFDVSGYLERHRVRAGFASLPRPAGISAGATLLNQLGDLHADLLVMGAYAHARARERVFGGVTQTLFWTMTVPVLMSH